MKKVFDSNLIEAFTFKLFEKRKKKIATYYEWGRYNIELYAGQK